MTVNQIIEAIALKLKQLYPHRLVYVDQIPKGANGNFYVHCTDQDYSKGLARRRSRSYTFEVLFFQSKKDSMSFQTWVEQMYFEFEQLQVQGGIIHLTNAKAELGDDMVFHFVFDMNYSGLLIETDQAEGEVMENLYRTEELS